MAHCLRIPEIRMIIDISCPIDNRINEKKGGKTEQLRQFQVGNTKVRLSPMRREDVTPIVISAL